MFKIFDEEMKNKRPHYCIREYKRMLAESDYLAIKFAEGIISEAGYEQIRTQRQQIRDEINALECIINS